MATTLFVTITPRELNFGVPIREIGDEQYAAWLDLAEAFLSSRFGKAPLWFAADWDRARAWAFPSELEATLGERRVIVDGDEFHLAFAERARRAVFAAYVESGDFRTDAILLVPAARDGEATVIAAIAQTARLQHGDTAEITVNVATSIGDGIGLIWLNHGCDPEALRAEMHELAERFAFTCTSP
jgi:hypothetical protein